VQAARAAARLAPVARRAAPLARLARLVPVVRLVRRVQLAPAVPTKLAPQASEFGNDWSGAAEVTLSRRFFFVLFVERRLGCS
jgi:hypothetical protein